MLADKSTDAPRDLKQVRRLKHKARNMKVNKARPCNVADDVLTAIREQESRPEFVRKVLLTPGKAPTFVLYTDEQITDMRRFCCSDDNSYRRSIIGIDRTFNLGPCFVTVMVYENQAVVRNGTTRHPTFVGPMFLHWDGEYKTYCDFLSVIRCEFDSHTTVSSSLVIGSDAEKALTKAVHDIFSGATQLLCVKHLQDNVIDYMRNKCGVPGTDRNSIVDRIFGEHGLAVAEDSVIYCEREGELLTACSKLSDKLVTHMTKTVLPAVHNFVFKPKQQHSWLDSLWMNNRSESMNHVLKIEIDWKPQRIHELIDHLFRTVKLQISDLRRALYGHGNFALWSPFTKFSVVYAIWHMKSEDEKSKLFNNFLHACPNTVTYTKPKVIASVNAEIHMPLKKSIATKPGQRKRPRTERARPKFTA